MNDCLSSWLVIGSFVAGAVLASILFGIFSIVLWKLTAKGRITRIVREQSPPPPSCSGSTVELVDDQTPPAAASQQETTDRAAVVIAPPGDCCNGENASPTNAGSCQSNPPKLVPVRIYEREQLAAGSGEDCRSSAWSRSSEGSIVWENENGDFVLVGNMRRTSSGGHCSSQTNTKPIVTFRDRRKALRSSAGSSIVWENEIGDCVIVSNLRRQSVGNGCSHCRPVNAQPYKPSGECSRNKNGSPGECSSTTNQPSGECTAKTPPPTIIVRGRVSFFPPNRTEIHQSLSIPERD